jgi:hypothetical protein
MERGRNYRNGLTVPLGKSCFGGMKVITLGVIRDQI